MSPTLYVGTDSGVLTLRENGAGSWKVEQHALKGWSVQAVAAAPADPATVLAATRGDGVWLSRDAGQTWTKPSYGKRGPGKVRSLALDSRNPGRVYAGGEPIDLFVSDDLGASWETVDSVRELPSIATITYPVPDVEPHIRDITIDPSDSNVAYAALQVGFLIKSVDGGRSWRLLDHDVDADVHTIVVDPADRNTVLVATGGYESRSGRVRGRALYCSADGGESWEPTALEFSQEYAVPLVVHPRNSKILFSSVANGTPGAWRRASGPEAAIIRTVDGGQSWQQVGGGASDIAGLFASSIVLDEGEPDHVYAALNSGTILSSHDLGDSWTNLNVSLSRVNDMTCVHA